MEIDYEKKYEEALAKARAGKTLEEIFPEMNESEDERLRKLLVWQVYRNIEDETNDLAGSVYDGIKGHDPDLEESIEDWKKCLAYLEKQKEQKPAEYGVDVIKTSALLAADRLASAEMTGRLKERSEILNNPTKYGLQKPAEWSESDKQNISLIISYLDSYIEEHNDTFGADECKSLKYWLKALPERFILQPKPEWSEEDETRLTNILIMLKEYVIHHYSKDDVEKSVDWLENRVKFLRPQPKQEWSEEDEEMIGNIISSLRGYIHYVRENGNYNNHEAYIQKEIEFLNSLRPQPKQEWSEEDERKLKLCEDSFLVPQTRQHLIQQGLTPGDMVSWLKSLRPQIIDSAHLYTIEQVDEKIREAQEWKPSEEQMRALQVVVDEHWDVDGDALYSLYTDLKKLI